MLIVSYPGGSLSFWELLVEFEARVGLLGQKSHMVSILHVCLRHFAFCTLTCDTNFRFGYIYARNTKSSLTENYSYHKSAFYIQTISFWISSVVLILRAVIYRNSLLCAFTEKYYILGEGFDPPINRFISKFLFISFYFNKVQWRTI